MASFLLFTFLKGRKIMLWVERLCYEHIIATCNAMLKGSKKYIRIQLVVMLCMSNVSKDTQNML